MTLTLIESRYLRFFSFTIFYVAQGLPIGLFSIALPAWFAEQGATAGQIATFIAISGLPWGFKLIAGPIMDRFSFLPMGRRRPWVVAAQFGLFLTMFALGFVPDPVTNIALVTWMAFAVNSCAAMQDVAVDGMAIDVLDVEERGRANAFMGFGQVAGYAGSGALCGVLLVNFGLSGAAWVLSVGVGLIFLFAVMIRERQGEKRLPWSEGEASARSVELQAQDWLSIFGNLFKVMFLPASIILIAVTFCWRLTSGFWVSAAPVIAVQQLGYASTEYASWQGIMSFSAAMIGLLFGPVIDRYGARVVFVVGLCGSGVIFLVAGVSESLWAFSWFALFVLAGESVFGQAIFVSFIALHMNICWARVSATQFAIYMAWANLARSIGAGIYAEVEAGLTQGQEFLVMAASCGIGAGLLLMVKLIEHQAQVDRLESDPMPILS